MKFMDKLKFYKKEYDEFKRGKPERDRIYEEQRLEQFESLGKEPKATNKVNAINFVTKDNLKYTNTKEFKHFKNIMTPEENVYYIGRATIVKIHPTRMIRKETLFSGLLVFTDWGLRYISFTKGLKVDEIPLNKATSMYKGDLGISVIEASGKKYKYDVLDKENLLHKEFINLKMN